MINWIIPENGVGWSSINVLDYIKEKTGNDNARISYKYIPGSLNVNYRTLLEIPDNIEILNLPKNILKVAEKKTFRLTVRKLLPQYSPKIYLLRQHFLKFPIIVRPDQHQQGRDFKILKSYDELRTLPVKYTHGIEIIYPNIEYRVICARKFNNEIIVLSFKRKEITYKEDNNPDNWLKNVKPKNYSLGRSVFKWIERCEGKDEIKSAAIKAFKLSGLHFGACDVLYDTERKKPFVIEINSRFASESQSLIRLMGNYIINYEKDYLNQER